MSPSSKESQSPFLDSLTFEEPPYGEEPETASAWYEIESPFRSMYELDDQLGADDPEGEELAAFLAELHDQEFDHALFELANEAADLVDSRFEGESAGYGPLPYREAERMLAEHFAPLTREIENMLDALAQESDGYDLGTMTDSEIDTLVDRYVATVPLTPAFEQFFGSLKKKLKKAFNKVKKVATKVASGVKKVASALGVKGILKKVKALIKPLLNQVLRYAINKLPRQYRPLARKLARRFVKEAQEETAYETTQEEAGGNVQQIQYEFDAQLAHLLFAEVESEQDLALAEYAAEAEGSSYEVTEQMELARAEFVERIAGLDDDDDPTPAMEQFIPALLPALKIGIRLIGRKRVVNFLARYLARLVRRFIGPRYARPLSRAIVDAGLRMINLETTPEDELRLAAEAVATTIEETVRQVAALPESVLDDPELLEAATLEAFETQMAANAPPILRDSVYQERPELREAARVRGCWVKQPLRGRKYYKKFTKVFEREITPPIAQMVKTWRGVPLTNVMRDMYGMRPGQSLRARIHLYEALPNTWLSRISKYEKRVPGLASSARSAWSQVHPLTPEAAAVLLGEPRLGRVVAARYLSDPLMIGVGQRFYYLELPDSTAYAGVRPGAYRCCLTHLTLDFPRDQIGLSVFVSEAEAQTIAIKLRQRLPWGLVMNSLRPLLRGGLHAAFDQRTHHQVRTVHAAVPQSGASGTALDWVPPIVLEAMEENLRTWAESAIGQNLRASPQLFIAATEDPSPGVTVHVTFNNPPGFAALRKLLAGKAVSMPELRLAQGMPEAQVKMVPGFWYG